MNSLSAMKHGIQKNPAQAIVSVIQIIECMDVSGTNFSGATGYLRKEKEHE